MAQTAVESPAEMLPSSAPSNFPNGENTQFDLDSSKMAPLSDEKTIAHYRGLLKDLTLEEKVGLLSGTSFTSMYGVPRLNIPALKVSDSINGVRGSSSHLEDRGTACFPSTTCLAATWNKQLLEEMGKRVAFEAKKKSVQTVMGPTVNMHRDPRGGRNFETFSEDPLLTGQLAACIVNGMQSQGVASCTKHFVCNDSETKRRAYNVAESEDGRTMREIYAGAFQHVLRNSNPASIMTAYNKVNGQFCSESRMIKDLLRRDWKYDGCIISDWYGTHSGPEALKAGLDLEMPGPSVFRGEKLKAQIEQGLVDTSDLDEAVSNVLTLIGRTAASHSSEPERSDISPETSEIARKVASEGIVLLKNQNSALPLDFHKAPKIAVIGDPAINPSITGGGSAHAHPQYIQKPLDCIKAAHPSPDKVGFARGVNPNYTVPVATSQHLRSPTGKPGVDVEYFNDGNSEPVFRESLEAPQVVMLGFVKPGLHRKGFHYVISTTIRPSTTGKHTIAVQVTGQYSLIVDEKEVLAGDVPDISVEDFLFVPKKLERATTVAMEAGRDYSVRLRVHSRDVDLASGELSPNAAKLCYEEEYSDDKAISEAVELASKSDVSIIFGGRTHEHESEGFDLTTLKVPENQSRMISAVAKASPVTVLVLHGGNPIDVSDFIEDIDGLLVAHFPGQEGGQAITDIIQGKTNPSGRLATSWPKQLDEACVPSYANFPAKDLGNGPELKYAEGLQIGYRNEKADSMYRWQLGFGLSYSTFTYSSLSAVADRDAGTKPYEQQTISVEVVVRNEGPLPGYEVVQLYTEPPSEPGLWRPKRELKAFTKEWLLPGQTKTVRLSLPRRDVCGVWDESELCWRTHRGTYGFVIDQCHASLEFTEDQTWTGL